MKSKVFLVPLHLNQQAKCNATKKTLFVAILDISFAYFSTIFFADASKKFTNSIEQMWK
jgi:hypothetical protein